VWKPLEINTSSINKECMELLFSDETPAVIIRNFYEKKYCKTVVDRIKEQKFENFQNQKLNHIGPFLMSFITKKNQYFDEAKLADKTFNRIFYELPLPSERLYKTMSKTYPQYSISVASESQNRFSPFVIRIHDKGKLIPIHKDHVGYEGKEYGISNIDKQLSCVLHLQESELGGDLIIYQRQWTKKDEKFRKIDFGYSSDLISSSEFYKISNLESGDLVLINPNYYHEVTTIEGETPRVTLGMFLGFYEIENKIVVWA
jgi:hypothetical protein